MTRRHMKNGNETTTNLPPRWHDGVASVQKSKGLKVKDTKVDRLSMHPIKNFFSFFFLICIWALVTFKLLLRKVLNSHTVT